MYGASREIGGRHRAGPTFLDLALLGCTMRESMVLCWLTLPTDMPRRSPMWARDYFLLLDYRPAGFGLSNPRNSDSL